jgi:hypothetical protein
MEKFLEIREPEDLENMGEQFGDDCQVRILGSVGGR